jgi:preprotein translocase subunit SecG
MMWIFLVLVVLVCVILGALVLMQNSKGGGLSGSFSGISNQLMGVKKTTDVLENGTWLFAAILGVLCLFSSLFIPRDVTNSAGNSGNVKNLGTNPAAQQQQQPLPGNPTTPAPAQQKP